MATIPYVIEQNSRGERSYDIYSRLLNDRIIMLKKGKVVKIGTPEEVLTAERIQEVFGIRCNVTRNERTGRLQITYEPASGDNVWEQKQV